jgi:Secretion system C-terminal sorting domain/PKD domain
MKTVFLFIQILLLFPTIGSAQSSWVRKNDYFTIEAGGDYYFYKRTASGVSYFARNSIGFLGDYPHLNLLQRMDVNGNPDSWYISNTLGGGIVPWFNQLKIIYSDVLEATFSKLAIAGVGYQNPSFGGTGYFPYMELRNSTGAGLWKKMYITPSEVHLTRVQQGPSSGYTLMGSNYTNAYLTGLDSVGNILWSKSVPTTNEFIRTANNGYLLLGNGILRLDSLGNHIWHKRHGWFQGEKMVSELPGGNICIIGVDSIPGIGYRTAWMLLDASGNLLSAKYYNTSQNQGAIFAVACNSGGFSFLTFLANLVRLDANGNVLWSNSLEMTCPNSEYPIGFGELNDGGFMIEEYGWTPVPNPPIAGTDLHVFRFQKTDPLGSTPCSSPTSWNAISYSPVVTTLANPVTSATTTPFNPTYDLINPGPITLQIFDNCPTPIVCANVVASFSASATDVCVYSNIVFTNMSQNWDYGSISFNGNNYGVVNTGGQNTMLTAPATPGIYQAVLVVNEGCCSDTTSITITVANNLSFSLGPDITICSGSSATLGPVSGAFPNYAWSTGPTTPALTVTTAGTYSLTVSSGTCTGSDTINVAISQATVNLGADVSQCGNAPVTLDAGSGFTTYNWSGGGSGQTNVVTSSGSYTVTVSNSVNCTGTDQINVTMNPEPSPVISGIFSFCEGANTLLDAGAGYASYQWSNGPTTQTLSVTAPGTYSVTVASNFNCEGIDTVLVTQNPWPDANWTSAPNNLQVSFTDLSQNAQSWLWNFGTGTSTIQNPVFTFPSPGIYPVCLYVTNSCGTDSLCNFLNLTSNAIVNRFEGDILIYPNPSGGMYQIEITPAFPSEIELEITDELGRIVWHHPKEKINSMILPVDLSSMSNGVYFLKVASGDSVSVFRLVKE